MKGGVFALGNFDGVHKGHQAVIQKALDIAQTQEIPAQVLTFEPHPRTFFQPTLAPFRLTPPTVKDRLIRAQGIANVIALPFDRTLAEMSAQTFIDTLLVQRFGVTHLVAGHDFVFGHRRDGTVKTLETALASRGVGVTEVPELGGDGEVFSSTRVRELLLEGEVEAAASILGRPWSLEGSVVKGAGIGRKTLAIPTANIDLGDYLRPKFGAYVIRAGRAGSPPSYTGVANIGFKPTVDGKKEQFEAHLFDFNQDIYGETWAFELLHFLRPEKKFDSLEALKAQILADMDAAKRFF